jgi:hypothetical protein
VEIKVQAQQKDINGNFIGARGNIVKDTSLILPGLNQEFQKDIYARTNNDFTGGVNNFEKMILEKDIEQSKIMFQEKLKSEALKNIKNRINELNTLNNTQIDILS